VVVAVEGRHLGGEHEVLRDPDRLEAVLLGRLGDGRVVPGAQTKTLQRELHRRPFRWRLTLPNDRLTGRRGRNLTSSSHRPVAGAGRGRRGPMDDYPIKVGAMLFTMVDPNRGHEVAYNRWYERDHFYAGCMIGPGMLAGRRWVAPEALKELRFPAESEFAQPVQAGSYLATYCMNKGHEDERI